MAKNSKKTAKINTVAKPAPSAPRQLKRPVYKSFSLQRRIKPVTKGLPGAFRLFGQACKILGQNWKVFLGIIIVYGVLNLILVRGFSGSGNITQLKTSLDNALHGDWSQVSSAGLLFVYLLGSAGNTASATAGAYQLILTLVASLALIWTLRSVYGGTKVRIRDGFYNGMYPLVKFMLVLLVIGLQLIPGAIGILLYSFVVGGGVAASFAETAAWTLALMALITVSLYMVSSSLFALYIVCLPDMTPIRALRSARSLVAARRWNVLRKVLFLPVSLAVLVGLVVVPLIIFVTPVAAWVLYVLTMLLLPLLHCYMYRLYRALL